MLNHLTKWVDKIGETKFIAIFFVISFLIRLIYSFHFYQTIGTKNFSDDIDYLSYAREILQQGILVPDISKIFGNGHQVGIGWPLIIATLFRMFGEELWSVFLFNITVSSLQVVLIYHLGKMIFNKPTAILAALWAMVYIKFIKYCPGVLKENLIHLMLILSCWLFLKVIKENNKWLFLLFIIQFAYFLHIDERYLFISPVFFFGFCFMHSQSQGKGFQKAITFASLVFLLCIPWTLRNNMVYGRPVLLAYQTSSYTDIFLGYDRSRKTEIEDAGMKSPYEKLNHPHYEWITREIQSGHTLSDSIYDDYKYIAALEGFIEKGIIPHTFSGAENIWANFTEFFRPFRFSPGFIGYGYRPMAVWPLMNNLVVLIQYGIPLLLFCFGLFIFKKKKEHNFLILLLLAYAVLHIFIVMAIERYRTPIDFIIFLFASATIVHIIDNRFGKYSTTSVSKKR